MDKVKKKRLICRLIGVALIVISFALIYVDAILKTGWISPFLPLILIIIGLTILFIYGKPLPKLLVRAKF